MFSKMFTKAFENEEEENQKLYTFIGNIIQLLKGQIKHEIIIEVELKNESSIKKNFRKTDDWLYNIRLIGKKLQMQVFFKIITEYTIKDIAEHNEEFIEENKLRVNQKFTTLEHTVKI